MKTLKINLLLTLIMSFVTNVVDAHDIEVKNSDGVTIYYNYIKNSACIEVTYKGSYASEYSNEYSGDIKIPETVTYDGFTYTVVHIGNGAFNDCKNLTSIYIPSRIISIGSAFINCSGLEKITVDPENFTFDTNSKWNAIIKGNELVLGCKNTVIPDGIIFIDNNAFNGCTDLTSIKLPESVSWIGDYAFKDCRKLNSVEIPHVSHIGHYAFEGCEGLTSIRIPYDETMTTIGNGAFYRCTGLTSVELSNTINHIGQYAFFGCQSLSSIDIPNSVKSIGSNAFEQCSSLKVVRLSENLTSIDASTFQNCNSLISCEIPESVVTIGKSAFKGCSNLTSINIHNGINNVSDEAFWGCNNLTSIEIPNSIKLIGNKVFKNCPNLNTVIINNDSLISLSHTTSSNVASIFGQQVNNYIIGNEVTSIGRYAFYGSTKLTSLIIPSTIKAIGADAVGGCNALNVVNINSDYIVSQSYTSVYNLKTIFGSQVGNFIVGDSVKSVGANAFYGCTSKIKLPHDIVSIGPNAFKNCTGLEVVSISKDIKSIGESAFEGCTNLSKVIVPNISSWCDLVFNNPAANPLTYARHIYSDEETEIMKIVIPEGVTSIGNYAFYNGNNLSSISIPNSVNGIGTDAFSGCSALITVNINSNNIMSMNYSSDYNLSTMFGAQVERYIIGDKVNAIGDYAFYKSTINTFKIPKNVVTIGNYAFSGCSKINTINIPNKIAMIANSAFEGCTGLSKVIINDLCSWCNVVFKNINANPLTYAMHLYCNEETEIKELVIPKGVTSIGNYAFYNGNSISSVSIPSSVATIGTDCFNGCGTLIAVNINSNDIMSMKYNSDYNLSTMFGAQVESYIIGDEVTTIGDFAFYKSNIKSFKIQKNVINIGNYAFYGCSGLKEIAIPSNITTIGNSAFLNCTGLTKVITDNLSSWCSIRFADASANPLYYAKHLYNDEGTEITKVTIPDNITAIGNYQFYNGIKITSADIPNSIKSIGTSAFYGCNAIKTIYIDSNDLLSTKYSTTSNLSSVFGKQITHCIIGENVRNISNYAFWGCTMLDSVTIKNSEIIAAAYTSSQNFSTIFGNQVKKYILGDNVTSIGVYAFYNCSKLESINISNTTTEIGKNAFSGCKSISSLCLPENLTYIGEYAFSSCTGLKSVCFSNAKINFGSYAFSGCDNITKVKITDLSSWCGMNFANYDANPLYYAKHIYNNDDSEIVEVVFPENTLAINDYLFYNAKGITSITIPDNIQSIGTNAFTGCSGINIITINSNIIASQPYSTTTNFATIFGNQVRNYIIGDNVTSIGDYAFYGCNAMNTISLPDGLTTIGNNTFKNCTALSDVTIPKNVEEIGNSAFNGCNILSIVTINSKSIISKTYYSTYNLQTIFGNQVKKYVLGADINIIGDYAFFNCTGIESLYIPNNVTTFGNYAFYGCSGLKSINIPSSITTIGIDTFYGCTGLTKVITGSISEWCNVTFKTASSNPLYYAKHLYSDENTEITKVQIPTNLTNIGKYLFYNACGITTLVIPSGIKSIGESAFYGCENLADVSIYSNSIMYGNYSSTSNLSTIFGSQVKKYTIGAAINKIEDYTFYNCNELSSIIIPNTVRSIGNYAFRNCENLSAIKIPDALNTIGEYAFGNCKALNSLTFPETLSSIGKSAFYGCKLESLLILAKGCNNESTFNGLDKSSVIYTYNTEISTIKKSFTGKIIALDCDVYKIVVNNLYFRGFDFVVKNDADNNMTHRIIDITINEQLVASNQNGVYEARELNNNTSYDIVLNYENTINVNGETHIIKGNHKETIKTKDLYISSSNVSYTSTQTSFTIDGINAPYDKTAILQKVGFIYDGIEYDLGTQITGLEPLTSYQQSDSQSIYTGKYPVTVFADYNDGTHISQDIIVYTKHMTPTINVDTSYPTKLHIVGNDGAGDAEISETWFVYDGKTVDGNTIWLTNLVPNSYITVYYYVKTTGGTEDRKYASLKTPNVNFTTLPGKAVKAGEVIVAAKTNLPDEEVNVGFEWRKTDAPDDLPSSNGPGALYEGMLEAKIKNLSVTSYYRVRPYYEDANNKLYYGDWIAFDPSDFSYCEPTVHTYASAILKNNTATLTGYALSGSDDVIEQGFEYWTNSVAYAKSKGSTTNEYIQKVVANGQRMTATVDNLIAGTKYSYRAYLTTARGTTYGEEQTFTTSTVDGIVDIEAEQLKDSRTSKGVYTLSGLKVCDDVVDLKTLPRGIYIINGKKVVVK